jgi:hypothetical protein
LIFLIQNMKKGNQRIYYVMNTALDKINLIKEFD